MSHGSDTAIALGTQDRCSLRRGPICRRDCFSRTKDATEVLLLSGLLEMIRYCQAAATSADTCSCSCKNETSTEAEVVLPELWCQLELTERQRFGHCFSSLVLKALGHCAGSAREVEL